MVKAASRLVLPTALIAVFLSFMIVRPVSAKVRFGQETDSQIVDAMRAWNVPGLAIAVIQDGTVVYSRVFGTRDLARRLPVTRKTLFAVGSVTKSFTVAGLSLLVQEEKLSWDRPAREFLPVFGVRGERHSRAILLRDLVSHRTGVPRHDALWYFNAHSRAELVRRLRYLNPVAPVGARYGYHNLMVMAAGYLAGKVARTTWEDFTRKRLLDPLRMFDTRLSLHRFLDARDRAAPYFPGTDGVVAIEPRSTDIIGPAASVYSNLSDMTTWLRFQLNLGEAQGRRLLSREAMAEIRVPRIPTGASAEDPALGREAYAMGFFVQPYRKNVVVRHPGVIDGYTALLSMMPRRRTGMIILTNLSGNNGAPTAIERYVYDRILGQAPLPWIQKLKAAQERHVAALRDAMPDRTEPPSGRPANPMRFVGTYIHPAYGAMRLALGPDGETLEGTMHGVRFALRRHDRNEWRVAETAWPLRAGLRFRFRFDTSGKAYQLRTPLADGPGYRLRAGSLLFVREGTPVPYEHRRTDPDPPLADRLFR